MSAVPPRHISRLGVQIALPAALDETERRVLEAAAFLDVTAEDPDATDTLFLDKSTEPLLFYLVTGVGPNGEGPRGHFGE